MFDRWMVYDTPAAYTFLAFLSFLTKRIFGVFLCHICRIVVHIHAGVVVYGITVAPPAIHCCSYVNSVPCVCCSFAICIPL